MIFPKKWFLLCDDNQHKIEYNLSIKVSIFERLSDYENDSGRGRNISSF